MRFKRKLPVPSMIPAASISDIVFTLLLFFMISTVIRKFNGLPVTLPEAHSIEKIPSKTHTSYVWIDRKEHVVFDDTPIASMDDLYTIARAKIEKDHRMLLVLRADKEVGMGILSDVQEQLRRAGALRIYYGAEPREQAGY